jgi:hypothetical protein
MMNKTMKVLMVSGLSLAILSGCSRPEKSMDVLIDARYTDIELTGYSVFGCSDDDVFRTGFIARSSRGKTVKGVVCSAPLKGSTIRIK